MTLALGYADVKGTVSKVQYFCSYLKIICMVATVKREK